MRGIEVLLAAWVLFTPQTSQAMQLHWISGSSDLSFYSAVRCTLLLEAEPGETLPAEWRLLWVTDNEMVKAPLSFVSETSFTEGEASVCNLTEPSNPVAASANEVTAEFCSNGQERATSARFVLDVPGGTRGKVQAVAFYPTSPDSTVGDVSRSSEATLNGGSLQPYPATIFHATRSHESDLYRVQLAGLGFAQAVALPITGHDESWSYPLSIVAQTDSSIIGEASLAADVPACIVSISTTDRKSIASTALPSDPPSMPLTSGSCISYMREPNIQPKDFALVFARDTFHVFYIRQRMGLANDDTEKDIGHAVSATLESDSWQVVDTAAIHVNAGRWDNFHVWAPSVILQGVTYYMFYTGVTDTVISGGEHRQNQRIGVATSQNLNTWDQDTIPVLTCEKLKGSDCAALSYPGSQLRDAFVMKDPNAANHYLMYYVAVDSSLSPTMVVGVASSIGDNLRQWSDSLHLVSTDTLHTYATLAESPHVVANSDSSHWLLFLTTGPWNPNAPPKWNPVAFEVGGADPIDPVASHWTTPPDTLYHYLGDDPRVLMWHASEYLKWANHEYLAAWDDDSIAVAIGEMQWTGPTDFTVGCVPVAGVERSGDEVGNLALGLDGYRIGDRAASVRMVLPLRLRVKVAIYDVMGRRRRTLADGVFPAGKAEMSWDMRDERGQEVLSGVYFVALSSEAGRKVAKMVVLR